MGILWVFVGAGSGLALGVAVGLGLAVLAMCMTSRRDDGTYGIREMITCLPIGTIVGLALGLTWGVKIYSGGA